MDNIRSVWSSVPYHQAWKQTACLHNDRVNFTELRVICATARGWGKSTCQAVGVVPDHQNLSRNVKTTILSFRHRASSIYRDRRFTTLFIYLLIKYIKNVLWRVAKRLSHIQDARCPKVKTGYHERSKLPNSTVTYLPTCSWQRVEGSCCGLNVRLGHKELNKSTKSE